MSWVYRKIENANAVIFSYEVFSTRCIESAEKNRLIQCCNRCFGEGGSLPTEKWNWFVHPFQDIFKFKSEDDVMLFLLMTK